jgi:hypothetical protein
MARSLVILGLAAVACGARPDLEPGEIPDWSDVEAEIFDPDCDPPPCAFASVELRQASEGEWVKVICCNPYRGLTIPIAPE